MSEDNPNLEELKYVKVATKDGKEIPFKLTRLQKRLWETWRNAPKPVKWQIVKTGRWPHP